MPSPRRPHRPRSERSARRKTPAGRWTCRTRSARETERLGGTIGQAARGGEIVALFGDLGTGKTVLVRGIAAALGAPPQAVSSPTFVFVHEYGGGRLPLAHADLYRLEAEQEVDHIGLWDYVDGRSVVAVEWAERAGAALPPDRLEVYLRHRTPETRDIELKPTGARSQALLAAIRRRWSRRRSRSAGARR